LAKTYLRHRRMSAINHAAKLARPTAAAPVGAPGAIAAGTHFGDGPPPTVVSILPSAWPWYLVYGALPVVAAAALAFGAKLAARHLRHRPVLAAHPGLVEPAPGPARMPWPVIRSPSRSERT